MCQVIINADDYGLREGVTNAIAYCMKNRLISQTTAMVNMPNMGEAVRIAKGEGFFDKVGLHLNLTYGRPLTKNIQRSKLICTPDGMFSGTFHRSLFRRMVLPRFEREAIAEEARAQMGKYREYGFPMLHLDSHHHSHTDLSVAKVVIPLAKEYGFRSVRLSRNIGLKLNWQKNLYKRIINRHLKGSLCHTDFFGDIEDFNVSVDRIKEGQSFEIMTHPVYWEDSSFLKYVSFGKLYDYHTPIARLEGVLNAHRVKFSLSTYSDL